MNKFFRVWGVRLLVNCLTVCCCLATACSQSPTTTKTVLLDSIVQQFDAENNFHGSILVIQDGKVILDKGYGYSNKSIVTLNEPGTIFLIGSITKQFTAAIILLLQEQGKLSTTDTISKYFPTLKSNGEITIHHLLTHRSGLFNYTRDSSLWNSKLSEQRLVDYLNQKPLNFEPGSQFEYCNSGYWLLGRIIEKVTGKKYEEVVREWIFNPLNMHRSGYDFSGLRSTQKSTGYYDGMGYRPAKILEPRQQTRTFSRYSLRKKTFFSLRSSMRRLNLQGIHPGRSTV